MENDTIFAAEAEAEARGSLLRASNRNGKGKLSRTTSSTSKRSRDEESTPLLGERRGSIDDGERSRASGDEVPEWDFSRLPWWKRPSVCAPIHQPQQPNSINTIPDILAPAALRTFYPSIRRHCCPKAELDSRTHLQRLLFGKRD